MLIDCHHHLWNYSAQEYGWIGDDMTVLKRDFKPHDLAPLLENAGITGSVAVQARTSLEENDFLLNCAGQNPFIKAVVGWVDLTREGVADTLAPFANHGTFKGIRHVLQGEPDDAYCLRDDFNRGLSLLHGLGLVYDILILHRHLPNSIRMVDRHPEQIFVLDHIAKPRIASATPDPAWAKNLRRLAKREHVYCKLSGMATEVPPGTQWIPALLRPYFDIALEAFGPARLMFGSDWPVGLLRSDYQGWFQTVRSLTAELSAEEQAEVFGLTAARAYGIG